VKAENRRRNGVKNEDSEEMIPLTTSAHFYNTTVEMNDRQMAG
jgi:hypothetical protein